MKMRSVVVPEERGGSRHFVVSQPPHLWTRPYFCRQPVVCKENAARTTKISRVRRIFLLVSLAYAIFFGAALLNSVSIHVVIHLLAFFLLYQSDDVQTSPKFLALVLYFWR